MAFKEKALNTPSSLSYVCGMGFSQPIYLRCERILKDRENIQSARYGWCDRHYDGQHQHTATHSKRNTNNEAIPWI